MLRKNKTEADHLAAAAKANAKAEQAQKQLEEARRMLAAAEAEVQQAASQDAQEGAARARSAIRQGVKAEVETVPMPVRLEVSQAKALKVLAALEGTTASAIIRGCIRDHLIDMYDHLPGFAGALEAAGVKGL